MQIKNIEAEKTETTPYAHGFLCEKNFEFEADEI